MPRETLVAVEQVRDAQPGQWWDCEGALWTRTASGEWLDEKDERRRQIEVREGADAQYAADIFLAMIGLSRKRPGPLSILKAKAGAKERRRQYDVALRAYLALPSTNTEADA